MSYEDDYDPYEERMTHYANEYDRRRDEIKGGDFGPVEDRAHHPNRKVERKE